MKIIFITLLFSLSWNFTSKNEIKPLTFEAFKGPVPKDDLYKGALSTTTLSIEINQWGSKVRCRVWATFDSNLSYIRVKTDYVLKHENCHWYIACLEAKQCSLALVKYQHTDSTNIPEINATFERYCAIKKQLNDRFDEDTRNGQIPYAEYQYEKLISDSLKKMP